VLYVQVSPSTSRCTTPSPTARSCSGSWELPPPARVRNIIDRNHREGRMFFLD
jgi:hypothetical protein